MSIHQQERRKHNNTPYRAPRNHNTYRNKSNTSRNIGKAVLATVLPLVLYNVGRDQGQRPQEPGFSIDPITWVATPISDFVEDLIPTQPKLPDISTPSGIKQARQGMKDGDLTSVVAIPNSQYDLNLKGTGLYVQPTGLLNIALDSTPTSKDGSIGLFNALQDQENNGNVVAGQQTYYVPATTRSVELHNLEVKAGDL